MDAILTNHPLSRGFQGRLSTLVNPDALKLNLKELRQRPLVSLFKYLRSLEVNRLFLPIEDENSLALLPILKLLASIVPARQVYLVESDLRLHSISRTEVIGSALKLLQASVASRIAVSRARREIASLLKTPRVAVSGNAGSDVLYLNANLWFGVKAGGSIGHISGVVNGLLGTGCVVDLVSAGGRLMAREEARYTELRPPPNFGLPPELNHYRFHFSVVEQVKALMARRRFNLIYQRMSIANYSGVVLSRLSGVPLVLEYNGSEAWIAQNWGRPLRDQSLTAQVETANLRHAHLIVTISDVLRDELVSRGVEPERIVTYPNCIDPEMFDPARFSAQDITALRGRHGIAADATVVSFIGTFGQWHGAEVLAQAIRHLLDTHGSWAETRKVHFLLVGDGLRMPDVRAILGSHAQGAAVTLAGLVPQHEAPLYLAASDILASPHVPNVDRSPFFGSPTKLFEYMAMGKAIVASDLDQIGEVLKHSLRVDELPGENTTPGADPPALLCRPGSAEQLVEGLKFLVERSDWRKVLGNNARRLALERYTWSHHVRAILDGLQRIGIELGRRS